MQPIKAIKIEEPCGQSWQQMTVQTNGRHCQNCQKTVVDFSKMNNDEILSYLAAGSHVCGRFEEHQLSGINYQLSIENAEVTSGWKKWLVAAGLLGVGFLNKSIAQTSASPVAMTRNTVDTIAREKLMGKVIISPVPPVRKISGRVIAADDKLPIAGATVRIKGNNAGVMTSMNGDFNINIPDQGSTLVISYIGYDSQEISASAYKNNPIALVMRPLVMGEVMITHYPFYKRWYNRFIRRPIHKLFN